MVPKTFPTYLNGIESLAPDQIIDLSSRFHASPERIDLWAAFPREITSPQLLNHYKSVLSPEERARMVRFVRPVDQHRFLITRVLTRSILARYLDIDARSLTFDKNKYGRPHLNNPGIETGTIAFNIAHTDDLILLGITKQRTLGIDVESIQRDAASVDIANRFFSPLECTALNGLPAFKQHQRFFAYWTLKESYIKARGMGLSIPLEQFGFAFPRTDLIELSIDPVLADQPSRWQFWQMELANEFLTAICFSHEAARCHNCPSERLCRFNRPGSSIIDQLPLPTDGPTQIRDSKPDKRAYPIARREWPVLQI